MLAKGPNFVVSPRHPANLEYITIIESVCTKLGQQGAAELRADIKSPKLTKTQSQAIRELKRDRDHIVVTAD